MFAKVFITALAATAVLAEPVQRRQAVTSVDLASLQSQASALEAITSDEPVLPSSVLSVLATAVPTSVLTDPNFACEVATGTPAWYKSLPADVKSALTSYEHAAVSWYDKHSSVLAQFTSGLGAAAACTAATNGAKTAAGATGTAATATGTAGSGSSGSSGSAATAASGSGNGAVARPTGLVAAGIAGAVGALGLAIVL